jgi:hypothetical protein
MTATNERIERFKADAAEAGFTAGRANRDTQLQGLGLALMVIGVAVGLLLGLSSQSTADSRDILTNLIFAISMLGVTVLGLGIFLRYSLGKFLRVWLLRQIYEGQSNVAQVLEATRTEEPPTEEPPTEEPPTEEPPTDGSRANVSPSSDNRSDAVL